MSETKKKQDQKTEQKPQNDFMIEKIKKRPVNKGKLFLRTVITVAMAVIFGTVACVTFIVLEPVISERLHPTKEEPVVVQPFIFPEDQEEEEMSPEEMLADNIPSTEEPKEEEEVPEEIDPEETEEPEEEEPFSLSEEQIQEILSNVVLDRENYKQIYKALSEYVDEMNHSMVTITGVSSNVDWFNNTEESERHSSGVIVGKNETELFVLADYTPLYNAESLTMEFCFVPASSNAVPGYQISVFLKALDSATNLAVLSAPLESLPEEVKAEGGIIPAYLGSSNSRNMVGSPIIALGNPMGISKSMGYGMVTAVGNYNQLVDANYKLIQTDILGSPSAGGVLFNLQGQVVGVITTQKIGTDVKNVIYAYGISELKKRIEKMINGVPMPYLGIKGMDVTSKAHVQLGVPYGTFIKDIEMDSPVMQAGIQKGDVLTAFGEHSINSYSEYISALMEAEAGSTVELTIMRAAQEEYRQMVFEITLGER